MMDLPQEIQPDAALEDRVVSTLVAAGLVRRRRTRGAWMAAAAAVIVLAIAASVLHSKHAPARGNTYVLLLDEDSTYRPAPQSDSAERVAEVARWADSLDALGKVERAGRLVGPGVAGGLFIVRAANDSDAARMAATCPFLQWGGHIEVKRFEE